MASSSSGDSDWELADGDGSGSDAEWVIPEDDGYFPGRSMSGVFFPSNSRPSFASFHPTPSPFLNPFLSSIPSFFSISSSSKGLVLSRGPWSSYHISNPLTQTHALLPIPPRPHHPNSHVALTRDPDGPTYHLICALDTPHRDYYTFDAFSSSTGSWRSSEEEFAQGRIIPNSGVSFGCAVYWRTDTLTVVSFDLTVGRARILMPPSTCRDARDRWQLGEAAKRLCCVLVTGSHVAVYALGQSDEWILLGSLGVVVREVGEEWDGGEPIVCRELPRPLRFESYELEVLLLVDGKLVVVEWERRKMRVVQFDGPALDRFANYVPYIDSPSATPDFMDA